MVQLLHERLHLAVAVIVQQHPVKPLRVVPFDELRKLVAHEVELLAGVGHLIGIEYSEIREFVVVISRHLPDQRAFSVHDLVVAQRQDEVLGKRICHRERQRVVVALAVQRVERHIPEHVVHPAHVPLEQEAEAAHVIGLRDQREGRRFLRDHHDRRIDAEGGAVQLAQEIDRLEIFLAAEAVGLVVPPVIVEIEHRRHGVHADAVNVEALEPVAGVRDQERAHLGLAVVKNARRPVGMLVHRRVGQLIAARPVKLIQAVFILREVRGHPVEDDADVLPVALVHKVHQLPRRAVAVCRREVARHLIAPRRVVGVLHNGHQLDVRVAHILDIRDQLRRQIVPVVDAAVRMPLP